MPEKLTLKRTSGVPITGSSMHYSVPYVIPEVPPAELLAELDAAARALDELSARAAQLMLGMNEHTRGLRIEVEVDGAARQLSPTQLFELLDCA